MIEGNSVQQVLDVLDAKAVRQWCAAALQGLQSAQAEIDDLNVYPVPDGDTGTNLLMTMEAVAEALAAATADMAATTRAIAHGALMGARGNSGVILSQLLRGICEVFGGVEQATSQDLQQALVRAAQLAYAAVARPVEGTILSVVREAAAAAAEIGPSDLAAVVRAARSGAESALAATTAQLAALAAAGVVDAGGRGLCVLLQSLEQVVTGAAQPAVGVALLVPRDRTGLVAAREAGSTEFAYEVQFLLRDTGEAEVERLGKQLDALGDSLVVVGAGDLWNVHVHVNDVGAAVEAAVDAGRPFRITVTRFADEPARPVGSGGSVGSGGEPEVTTRSGRAVVVVAPGEGLARLFSASGALVVDGGPSANPSTAELLAAIRATGAAEVVLLPNDRNVQLVATAAAVVARDEQITVAVVPTRSVLQGLSALAVHEPGQSLVDDVTAMAAAAGATHWGEVTTAVREAATMAGICKPGDVLGLLEGDVAVLGSNSEDVAVELLDRMLRGGGELVTIVTGEQAAEGAGQRLEAHVARHYPSAQTVVYAGGQPHYPLLLGVE